MKHALRTLALAAGLALAACAPTEMSATVTRFHAEQGPRAGTFTILPDDRQRGSLEFQAYAEQVQARLQELGFRPMPASTGTADYIVTLDYGIGDRKTQVWYQPSMGPFGYGFGGRYGSGVGLGMGIPFGGYDYGETETWTTYPHRLAVVIYDGVTWRSGDRKSLFEGRAVADLNRPGLARAMPYLTRALFQNFPGNSGETVAVSVPLSGR